MIVDVAVPYRVFQTFHYELDAELRSQVGLGSIVQVPLGGRSTHGFVLGFPEQTDIDPKKLKPVKSVLVSEPLFDETILKFLRWVSEYYCHPLGEVIATAIPKQGWESKKRRSKKETEILGLEAAIERPTLTDEQSFALARILDPEDKRPVLLHGVTGSGKTEVYMNVLEHVLASGKGGIILVPEIALTPLLLGRFSSRFPGKVAVLHSDLTPRERYDQWQKLLRGEASVVVGARSAVFAPVRNLGLIVVDEEHEPSFKQEDSVRYHARDVAVVRGQFSGAKVVLGSATPSLESFANAQSGKYLYVTIHRRVEDRPLPKTTFVDMRDKANWYSEETPWLTRVLADKLRKTISEKQQALLFLNRLGFAHFLYCQDCGHTWRCLNCDVALTYYRHPPSLKCHYCGNIHEPPHSCEECQGTNLKMMGWGTEQVEKELKAIFPQARIGRMDRSVVKTRNDLDLILTQIARREMDIVIGTQMIAKGHDFPGISLVGILMADASLNMPDFRANEKTYQIITQVSGRAGRAGNSGEVVVQTMNPEHPILRTAAENRTADFYREELGARQAFGFPPYQRLAMLRFQHANLSLVERFSNQVAEFASKDSKRFEGRCQIIGPSEAPLSRLKNLYRWQCLVKSQSVKELQILLRRISEYANAQKSSVQMAVDVDPVNAM